jgi:hypothetical protein
VKASHEVRTIESSVQRRTPPALRFRPNPGEQYYCRSVYYNGNYKTPFSSERGRFRNDKTLDDIGKYF